MSINAHLYCDDSVTTVFIEVLISRHHSNMYKTARKILIAAQKFKKNEEKNNLFAFVREF